MLKICNNMLLKLYEKTSVSHFYIGASLARIGLGLIILYNYLTLYFQRDIIYGPNGLGNPDFTLYSLSNSPIYFQIIYHLGILISILFIIGYKGRLVSILNFIFVYSLINRGYLISDGGDNLMTLLLFYLMFADVTQYFSIDSKINKNNKNNKNNEFKNILHNFAIYACVIQICIVYVTSALYQLQGDKWVNGTAIYYITQVDIFSNPHLTQLLNHSDVLMTFLTYFSIAIKIAFPFMILMGKKSKIFIVSCIVMFHLGIGVFMGLVTFALTMIASETLIFSDFEYRKMSLYIRKFKKE